MTVFSIVMLQVRDIVRLVAQRSSQLIAAGIAALLRQMERDGTFGTHASHRCGG